VSCSLESSEEVEAPDQVALDILGEALVDTKQFRARFVARSSLRKWVEVNLTFATKNKIKGSGKQTGDPIARYDKSIDLEGPWKNVRFRMLNDYCTGSQISEYPT